METQFGIIFGSAVALPFKAIDLTKPNSLDGIAGKLLLSISPATTGRGKVEGSISNEVAERDKREVSVILSMA